MTMFTDTNECADATLDMCDAHAACENFDGGYNCTCNAGYEGDGKSCTCKDTFLVFSFTQ